MDSPVLHIDLAVPQGWHEHSDKQLRYAFKLIASNYTSDEIKTLRLFCVNCKVQSSPIAS
ncbi:MAG TPA: hypothetical protein PLT34_05750 [Muribaculaceae bacterium]|nr:hypothetical protein [Muribaculaceae bacterium]